ncbi:MAG: AmmeMemoRadiSam system protein B [Acidobacteriota bacterium]
MVRRPAVAGTWYPDDPVALRGAVETHLARAGDAGSSNDVPPEAHLLGIIAPHAGLVYSGPVAAYAYRWLQARTFDVIVLVGPSHHVAFEGVSVWPRGRFDTPLGPLRVDEEACSQLTAACPIVHEHPAAHTPEHSLEMQLPFLATMVPKLPIVPLVMGHQTRETAQQLGAGLERLQAQKRALLIASSDLSHFFDAASAARLDARVIEHVNALDAEGLMSCLERRPEHACGGGPMVSVLSATRARGASTSRVLRYADSGDVSGDKRSVVGYMAAAIWH